MHSVDTVLEAGWLMAKAESSFSVLHLVLASGERLAWSMRRPGFQRVLPCAGPCGTGDSGLGLPRWQLTFACWPRFTAGHKRLLASTSTIGSSRDERFRTARSSHWREAFEANAGRLGIDPRKVVWSNPEAGPEHVAGELEQKRRTQSLQALLKCRYTLSVPTKPFTQKQGQYLAFIYYYSKVNGRPPAEADTQRYFQVSPPSVHHMILALEANGFIERVPGQGRSIRLLIPREALPDLE